MNATGNALTLVGKGPEKIFEGMGEEEKRRLFSGRLGEALIRAVEKVGDTSTFTVSDDFIQVPKEKTEHLSSKQDKETFVTTFLPQNVPLWYAPDQIQKNLSGYELRQKLISKNQPLLGASHLEIMMDNWWRIPESLDHVSLVFMGTVFSDSARREEKLAPNQLFVYSMYMVNGERKVELISLAATLHRHHVIAVPEMPILEKQ